MVCDSCADPNTDCEPRPFPVRNADVPDIAVAALPLLERLRDTLRSAARFRDQVRELERRGRSRWNVPPLFFFQHSAVNAQPVTSSGISNDLNRYHQQAAAFDPDGAAAWDRLVDLTDDALSLLASSIDVRHAARAVPGLRSAADALMSDHPRAELLATILAVPDDAVVIAIHPGSRSGMRVLCQGIANLGQLHRLLAAAWDTDADIFDDDGRASVLARFQMYRAASYQDEGQISDGLTGYRHWHWPHELLATVPRENGERIVLLADPVHPIELQPVEKTPLLRPRLQVLERYSPAVMDHWIESRTGRAAPVSISRAAA